MGTNKHPSERIEFQQALRSCFKKRREAIETEQIERRNRTFAHRTPSITLRILRIDPMPLACKKNLKGEDFSQLTLEEPGH